MDVSSLTKACPRNGNATSPKKAQRSRTRPIHILLAEASAEDAALTLHVLRESKIWNRPHVVSDGEEALASLFRSGRSPQAQKPDLFLLDLDLPVLDGREVLCALRQDPELADLPVVVLSNKGTRQEILDAFQHPGVTFLTKPLDLAKLYRVVLRIPHFGLTIATEEGEGEKEEKE